MILHKTAKLSVPLALSLFAAAAAQTEAPGERKHQLQLGLHFTAPGNLEAPFVNLAKSASGAWTIDRHDGPAMSFGDALSEGFINHENGLPARLPEEARSARGPALFAGAEHYPKYYAGGYTFEWDGRAYGFLQGQPRDLQRRIGQNRVSFFVSAGKISQRIVRFSRIRSGVDAIRIYRDEHKKLIEAGEIWNPEFINYAKRYDILRTMDMQATNASPVRSFNDVARPDDAFYGNRLSTHWPAVPRYGVPYEILFDLAQKTDAKLWLHIPAMIGAPVHLAHPSLRLDEDANTIDPAKITRMGRDRRREIIDSPEWEIFAAEFADRLAASGYPPDRPLYIELGNEIWNFALPFLLHTNYAYGIGRGVNEKWGPREGYGILSARWAAALEAELAKRGAAYDITYVIASQTSWPATTTGAMRGFQHQLKLSGVDAKSVTAKTGVALTTYSSCFKPFSALTFGALEGAALRAAWERAIDDDAKGLKRRYRDFCIDGPDSRIATRKWVLKKWRNHQIAANRAGVRILGAYEGGSHDAPDRGLLRSSKFKKWWTEYHWGPYGADVVRQVNLSIIDAFPDIILSNYASMGSIGGAPWLDGHYARETEMLRMWDEFARPEHAE